MAWLPIIAAVLVTLTALLLLVITDWRWSIFLLAVQYGGVFMLVTGAWPINMAITKLISGWMAGTILAIAIANTPALRDQPAVGAPRLFYGLAALLVIGTVLSFAQANTWLTGLEFAPNWGALVLMGLGLLKLGFTSNATVAAKAGSSREPAPGAPTALQPLHTIIGLLTALAGFEIIYAHLESSVLIAGLLAGVNLALALAGAYLLLAPSMEDE